MPPDKEIRGCPAPGAKARLKASKPIGRYIITLFDNHRITTTGKIAQSLESQIFK